MRENLLYVPFRRTDPVKISAGLKLCIENDYHQHPEKFSKDLAQIDQLRHNIVEPTVSTDSLTAMFNYAAQLTILSTKFPSDIQVELTWYNTLGYSNAAVKYSVLLFDQINVIYNIGSLYSQLGFHQTKDQPEGQKKAYNYFQQAAGVFRYLIDEVLPLSETPIPMGLDVETLETLCNINLAQAQECFWQKAVADSTRDGLVAKLAAQVRDFYAEALVHANRSNSIRSEWVHHIGCKEFHFEAASQYRQAVHCLSKGSYGEEVARLRECINACKEGLMNSKYVSGAVLDDIQGLYSKAQSDFTRAEKDNDLIYVQRVPDSSNLPLIVRGPAMSKSLIPTELANSAEYLKTINSEQLFGGILPYAVYQASRVYFEQLESYVSENVASVVNKLIIQMHDHLAKLQLPGSLEAVEKPLGIPQVLLSHSEEIRSRGGVDQLQVIMNDIQKLSNEASNLLTEASDTLENEAQEDEMMRTRKGTDRWNRAASREAGQEHWAKCATLRQYLTTAANSDDLVQRKYSGVLQLLKVLENGKPSIEQFVPNTSVVQHDRDVQRTISRLREVLGQAKSLEVYWQQRLNHLKSAVHNVDLFPAMEQHFHTMEREDPQQKFTAAMFEPVYRKIAKGYDKDVTWAQDQQAEMNRVMQEIEQANSEFLKAGTTQHSGQRQNAIQSLEIAYSRFLEIQGNLEEGRKFYNNILDQLKGLLDDCKHFTYQRRVEGRDLESNLTTSLASESSGDVATFESTAPVKSPTPYHVQKKKPWH